MECNRTKLSSVLSYIMIIVNITSGLFFTPWLMHRLGTSQYAIYTLGMSIISYLTIELGISEIVTRISLKYIIEGNRQQVNRLMSIAIRIYLMIDILILILAIVMYFFIDSFFTNLTLSEIDLFRNVFIICAATVIVIFWEIPFEGLYAAYGKIYVNRLVGLGYKLSYVLVTVISISLYNSVIIVVLCYAVLTISTKVFLYLYITRKNNIVIDLHTHDREITKNLLGMSGWIIIAIVSSRYFYAIIPTLLGRFSNSFEITTFSVASAVEGYLFLFSNALNGIFLPRITRMAMSNDDEGITDLLIRIGRIQLMIISCIIIGIIGFGQEFISFWVGSEYKNAYVCLILILIPCIVHLTQTVALEATFAKNRIRERAIVYAVGTIISTVLTCILAPEFGAIGAAIGICVAELLCYEIGMNFVYKKMLNINIRHFFVQTHLKLLPPLIISLMTAFVVNQLIEESTIIVFITEVGIWAAIHLILLYTLGCNTSEKDVIKAILMYR